MNKVRHNSFKKILISTNYNFDQIKSKTGMTTEELISKLLSFIDIELGTKNNYLRDKKIKMNEQTLAVITKFISVSIIKISNSKSKCKSENKVYAENAIKMLSKELKKNDEKEYDSEIYELFAVDFIFDRKDIQLYKKIIEKYDVDFKKYFSNMNNISNLIERLVEEINKKKPENEILGMINILSYSFSSKLLENDDKQKIKNIVIKKIPKNTSNSVENLKKYLNLLISSISNYDSNIGLNSEFIARKYGISKEFYSEVLSETNFTQIKSNHMVDMTKNHVFTLDKTDIGSLEDAITIKELDNGNILLVIYVIDPFAYIPIGGKLEGEARSRTKNIYIKGDTITMFPTPMAYYELSLLAGENKKVIAHSIEFSSSLDFISFNSKPAVIKVNKNIKFSDFDNGDTSLSEKNLNLLLKITSLLKREYNLADTFYNSKNIYTNSINNPNKVIDIDSKSEEIIRFLKIFSNHMITTKHETTKHPFIYTVSSGNINLDSINDFAEIQRTFADNNCLYGAQYSHINTGHKNIGLKAYARTTTPARNYAALKNQEFYKNSVIRSRKYTDKELYLMEEDVKAICRHMNEKSRLIDSYISETNKNDKILRMRKG